MKLAVVDSHRAFLCGWRYFLWCDWEVLVWWDPTNGSECPCQAFSDLPDCSCHCALDPLQAFGIMKSRAGGCSVGGCCSCRLWTLHWQPQVTVTSPVAASEAPALGSSSFLAVCTAASAHTPTWGCPGVSESSGPSTKLPWILNQSSGIKSEEERRWAKTASTSSHTLPLATLRCSHRSDNSEGFKDQQHWGSVVVQDLTRLH